MFEKGKFFWGAAPAKSKKQLKKEIVKKDGHSNITIKEENTIIGKMFVFIAFKFKRDKTKN